MRLGHILGAVWLLCTVTVCQGELDRIHAAIQLAQKNILEQQIDGTYWNLPASLGSHYISQYALGLRWFKNRKSQFDPRLLKALLLKTQLPDGSWYATRDSNRKSGDLSATLFHYWFLKSQQISPEESVLKSARKFIISQGGIEKTPLMTKFFLALFNLYPWDRLPQIPLITFENWMPINAQHFAQWVTPHLLPLAYLRSRRSFRNLGESLEELYLTAPENNSTVSPSIHAFSLIEKLKTTQQPHGSWGAYTVSTLLTLMALEEHLQYSPDEWRALKPKIEKGFEFIESLYFENPKGAYLGVLDDGRYWDTILLTVALNQSGYSKRGLAPTVDYLKKIQTSSGGFPFGEDFEYTPDTDDTAEAILAMQGLDDLKAPITSAVRFLLNRQNRDGGWGAFAKDNLPHPFLEKLAKPFSDSADLFDESCPDITGHVLEALISAGIPAHHPSIRRAVDYLKRTQHPDGFWEGRWGVNTLYGTSAAIIGLKKANEDSSLSIALDWLKKRQNPDGGFGESTLSYSEPQWRGKGASTPTQTAWVLLALCTMGDPSRVSQKATEYLLSKIESEGRWIDKSSVGTGHPGLIYMDYPSYPYAFPLMALACVQK